MQERTKRPESIAIYTYTCKNSEDSTVRSPRCSIALVYFAIEIETMWRTQSIQSVGCFGRRIALHKVKNWWKLPVNTLLAGFLMKIPTARVNRRSIPSAKNDSILHHRLQLGQPFVFTLLTYAILKFYLVFGLSCFICALMNDLNLFVHILINDPN